MKACRVCGPKPIGEFGREPRARDGRKIRCRSCEADYHRERREAEPERYKEINRAYYEKHCVRLRENAKVYREKLRADALFYYSKGGPRCACPGCSVMDREFLVIDHVNGGGTKHREKLGSKNIYLWLKENGYPDGFQVLCQNCNHSLGVYGYCPHEKNQSLVTTKT